MKSLNIFFAIVIQFALCLPLQSVAQCTASNASGFLACLTSGSDNISVTGSFTIGGNIDLSGDVIDLGGGNRTLIFSGTVTVSSTTQFLGSGSVTVTNAGVSASPAGGQGVITFAVLNTRLATGNFNTLSDALNNVLPVELSAFNALPGTSGIELLWSTASELNNARFLIERSGSDGYFRSIGEVKGAGTTSTPQNYKFTDRAPLPGANYYRLRQEDFDGKFEHSPIIAAQGHELVTQRMKIAPNPVDGRQIRLEIPSGETPLRIELTDGAGRRTSLVFNSMDQVMEADLPQTLSVGMYYLTAVFADKILVSSIVVR